MKIDNYNNNISNNDNNINDYGIKINNDNSTSNNHSNKDNNNIRNSESMMSNSTKPSTVHVAALPVEPALLAASLRIAADTKEANISHLMNSSSSYMNSNSTTPLSLSSSLSLSMSVIPLKPGHCVRSPLETQKYLALLESPSGLCCTEIREKGAKKARANITSFETPCWSTSGYYEILDFGEIYLSSKYSSEKYIFPKGFRTVRSVKICILPKVVESNSIDEVNGNAVLNNAFECRNITTMDNINRSNDILDVSVHDTSITEISNDTNNFPSFASTESEIPHMQKSITLPIQTQNGVVTLIPNKEASYFSASCTNAPFVAVDFTNFISSSSSPSGEEVPLFIVTVDG